MSVLHHAEILENIFEEVQEAFPYLDEDKQIEIANQRFQDMCSKQTDTRGVEILPKIN